VYAIGKLSLATVLVGLAAAPLALISGAGAAPPAPAPLAHDHGSHTHAGSLLPDVKPVGEISHEATAEARRGVSAASPPVSASWAFRPRTVEELADRAKLVVEAEVAGVRRGAPMWPRGDSPHATAIPTQRIDLEVVDGLRGGAAAGDELTLFKTGGERGGAALSLEGDPPYREGERYVLFLEPRGDGTYIPSAPDGRLRLGADGEAEPLIEGPVGDALRGLDTASVARAARKG
jgi:hypothetical protein